MLKSENETSQILLNVLNKRVRELQASGAVLTQNPPRQEPKAPLVDDGKVAELTKELAESNKNLAAVKNSEAEVIKQLDLSKQALADKSSELYLSKEALRQANLANESLLLAEQKTTEKVVEAQKLVVQTSAATKSFSKDRYVYFTVEVP